MALPMGPFIEPTAPLRCHPTRPLESIQHSVHLCRYPFSLSYTRADTSGHSDSESSEALNNAINENHAKITVANYEYFESWTYATTIEYGNTAPYTSVAVPGRGYSVDDLNTVPIVDDMDQPSPYQPSPSRVVQDMTATMLTRPVITTVRVVKKPSVQVSKTTTLERSHPELSHNVHSSGARRAAIKWFAIRIPLHHFGTVYHMLGPVIVFTISYYFWEDMLMACMLGKCSVLGRLRI